MTLAPATELAVVAYATGPVTLAPAIEVNPDPLPVITPVALSVPVMFAPVPVTTSMFAFPATLVLTLPFAVGTLIFDVPLLMPVPVGTDAHLRAPEPSVCR